MKTSLYTNRPNVRRQGFSLVEMLVTIAIIGILSALALPIFGAQQEVLASIKAKRNAQELVATYTVARVAGIDFVVPGNLDATLESIITGATATSGAFKGRRFFLSNMRSEDLGEVKGLVKLQGQELVMR